MAVQGVLLLSICSQIQKCLNLIREGVKGGKSGRFREFKSKKIFSKTRFDGKHHGIGSFSNQNSSVMVIFKICIEVIAISICVYTVYFFLSLLKP